jgi:rod shape-determining protein MreD
MQSSEGLWVIALTVIAALWLSIIPMPEWALWLRPAWVAMVVLYWVLALPNRVGVAAAWVSGLLLDIVAGAPLGQNALALAVLAYITLLLYQRLRMFSRWQQAGVIFVLIGMNQMLGHWVQNLTGTASPNLLFLLPALISAALWPFIFILLRFIRRSFYVH